MCRIAHLFQLGTVLRHLGMDHLLGGMDRLQPGMIHHQLETVLLLLGMVQNI